MRLIDNFLKLYNFDFLHNVFNIKNIFIKLLKKFVKFKINFYIKLLTLNNGTKKFQKLKRRRRNKKQLNLTTIFG